MIEHPALMPYFDRYAALDMQSLSVILALKPGARLAGYDPLNLDNLLARAVIEDATGKLGLPDSQDAYALPVPLDCLWHSPDGLPLWAATAFMPEGARASDVAYWHKRVQSGRFTRTKSGKFSIRSTSGRYMERRVPLPTTVAECWVATCIGNAEEIARLLRPLAFVGKRRTNGMGEVDHWEIVPGEFALVRNGRLTRPMPMQAFDLSIDLLPGGALPEGTPSLVGWTPPQWKPSLFAPGWREGTPLAKDWLNGLE